jgi:hypothetical protein
MAILDKRMGLAGYEINPGQSKPLHDSPTAQSAGAPKIA